MTGDKVTAEELIAELQKLPPDAEVVTSIYGWEGCDLGPVSIVEPTTVVDGPRNPRHRFGRHHFGQHHVRPPYGGEKEGRTVYLLDTPA